MGRLIQIKPSHSNFNHTGDIVERIKKQKLLNRAIAKGIKDDGIDFYKVAIGDQRENQRLQMKRHQERLDLY